MLTLSFMLSLGRYVLILNPLTQIYAVQVRATCIFNVAEAERG